MASLRRITHLQIFGSNGLHDSRRARRRSSGRGVRLFKNRARALPRLELLEDRMLLSAYTVTNTGTTNVAGTLLYAINQLNSSGGPSNIMNFNIPGSGVQTISPASPGLPTITEPVSIEGTDSSGVPQVQILGGSAGSNASGLTFGSGSSGSSIQDLAIAGFTSSYGIEIMSSGDSVVGCWLGINASGTANANLSGVAVDGSGDTIGGTTTGAANFISGNTNLGVDIDASCLVEGNDIGTNQAGTTAVANRTGIEVSPSGSGATIGATSAGAANIVAGNTSYGIYILASCMVVGDDIGTNAAGTAALANGEAGVDVAAQGATIARNSITGGVGGTGIAVSGNSSATITNNAITGSRVGVKVGSDASDTSNATVNDNDLSDNATGVENRTNATIDATQNWWGDKHGPTTTANPGGDGPTVFDNVSFTPWIGLYANSAPSGRGFEPTGITLYAVPTKLVFVTEPSSMAKAGDAFARQPVVEAEDASGYLGVNFDSSTATGSQVAFTLNAESYGGTLAGISTVDANGGYATFSGLSITLPGVYTLTPSALPIDPWSGLFTTDVPSTSITVPGPPTSAVNSLPATTTSTSFTVRWTGTAGPGATSIASFTIDASEDGGPFTAFLANTTSTSTAFTGQFGHTYGFYSVATDNLDDVQPTPTGAQATTTLASSPTQTTIIGEKPLFHRTLNKKGKPIGKQTLVGFAFEFSESLAPASADNSANYQLDSFGTKRVKKKVQRTLHPITISNVSYTEASDSVTLTLASKQTFPTGGQITVLGGSLGGITGSSGAALGGNTVFTISKGGNTIGPAGT